MDAGQTDILVESTVAVRGEMAGPDDGQLLEMYRQMVLCRALDERVWLMNRQGKAAIVASAQGHEAGQIGSVAALRVGHDRFYIYYRDLAVLVSVGLTPAQIMSGFLARVGEPLSGARQFPTHGAHAGLKVINLSNVVATQIPQAVGDALASKMRGEDTVTIVYFGDGAASAGDCHEGMNFAAIHKLPVIFFCENNGYAISVPLSKQMAVGQRRGPGRGLTGCPAWWSTARTSRRSTRLRQRPRDEPAWGRGRRSSRRWSSATCPTRATTTTAGTGPGQT